MSTIVRNDKTIAQSSKSFDSILNSIRRQRQPPSQLLISNVNTIDQLDIAEGLKKLLLTYGFTLKLLQNISSNDLAEMLGIDKYIASIIVNSARIC